MRAILVALFLVLIPGSSNAASLERFQSYVRSTASGRADFEQKVYDKDGKLVQESKGSFSFQRPGRFRWTYVKPPQVIVGDGERVWIHDRDLNQVTVRRMSKALGSTPAALLAGSRPSPSPATAMSARCVGSAGSSRASACGDAWCRKADW